MARDRIEIAWREYLETVAGDIRIQLAQQRRNVTYKLSKSIRVVENQYLKAQIRSLGYMGSLEDGQGARPRSTGPNFLQGIMDWMQARGIHPLRDGKVQPNTQANIKRAAFGIMRNQVQKGNAVFRGEKGIELDLAMEENKTKLTKSMADGLVKEFQEGLKIKRG